MAKRLATHYELLKLELTFDQMKSFLELLDLQQTHTQVRILENGDHEFILYDQGMAIPLTFHPLGQRFVFEGSFTVKDLKLANTFRKAIQQFEGHGKVQRVYEGYHMEYSYQYGQVTKIQECRGEDTRLVFEFKDITGELKRLLIDQSVEDQIAWVRLQIDQLLDQRRKGKFTKEIDQELKNLTHELFILEA
ncbi:non-ribosomal peptide synthetase module [Ammoniphilus sp. CFH 90114]|uniref:non-ribosomal peptide synthetase module n=1 Tax=Ammoniphilus sp. CFH 90114 TaxID=2493665 RepID=UPI00100FE980|nr:non-ribosomal peptide synthetase module [Ammoniphilus sp. CFH 90114]RXT15440.1 non-ribosomal peptide synthetase module [Ammoniphilus sp. CFH 90114]